MALKCGIICAGNWIVDHVYEVDQWPRERDLARIKNRSISVGGGAANVSSVLAKLQTGLDIWPMGAVGNDASGQRIINHCRERGFPSHLITTKSFASTARTHVVSVRGQSRTHFYEGGASDKLSEEDFRHAALDMTNARVFYLGYLTLLETLDRVSTDGSSSSATVLARAKAIGMTTCVDLTSVDRPDYAEIVSAALPHIDYLIINQTEAALATQTAISDEGFSDEDVEVMASRLLDGGVHVACIIHSPEKVLGAVKGGARIWHQTDTVPESQIISPLGAGDAFCAALLYAIHQAWELSAAIELAVRVATASLNGTDASRGVPALNALIDGRTDDLQTERYIAEFAQ